MVFKEVKINERTCYVATTIVTAIIHLFFSIYIRRIINPNEYGIYSACLLLQTYLSYIQLGTLNSFNRDYPQLIGGNYNDKAKTYSNNVLCFLILIFSLCEVLIVGFILFLYHNGIIDKRYQIGLIAISIITMISTFEQFGSFKGRIDRGFSFISKITIIELLPYIIGFTIATKTGYYTPYIVLFFSAIIGAILYSKTCLKNIKLGIDWSQIWDIILLGFPLLVNAFIWSVVNSIDKFVILGLINTEALGNYSIAQMIFRYMILVPSSLSQVYYAKMGMLYGSTKSLESLMNLVDKYSRVIAWLMGGITVFAYCAVPFFVSLFMPMYVGGVASAKVLSIGLYVYSVTIILTNILSILKQNKKLLLGSVIICITNALLSIVLINFGGKKIEFVAIGSSLAYSIYGVLVIIQVSRVTGVKVLNIISSIYKPAISMVVPSIILYRITNNYIISIVFSIITGLFVYLITENRAVHKIGGNVV